MHCKPGKLPSAHGVSIENWNYTYSPFHHFVIYPCICFLISVWISGKKYVFKKLEATSHALPIKRKNIDKKQSGLILENIVCYKVVRMTGELFHGGEDMVGTMTSGNYKSINQAARGVYRF